jgi:hypothetical protein
MILASEEAGGHGVVNASATRPRFAEPNRRSCSCAHSVCLADAPIGLEPLPSRIETVVISFERGQLRKLPKRQRALLFERRLSVATASAQRPRRLAKSRSGLPQRATLIRALRAQCIEGAARAIVFTAIGAEKRASRLRGDRDAGRPRGTRKTPIGPLGR